MSRKHFRAEEIIHKLREAEVLLAQEKKTPEVCKKLGVAGADVITAGDGSMAA